MSDWSYHPPTDHLVVLHADRDLVVIDKPAGLLSVAGRGPGFEDCAARRVAEWLAARPGAAQGGPLAAHRLDLDTSGVLVFALRRKAEAELHRQFRERLVEKVYVARVAGHPVQDEGLIDLALSLEEGAPRSRLDPAGRPARTRWKVVSRDDDGTARVELSPETGRPHQLRLHLLALGHPILGDRFYAPPEVQARAPRLLLHARSLRLHHPYSGEAVGFEAAVPFG